MINQFKLLTAILTAFLVLPFASCSSDEPENPNDMDNNEYVKLDSPFMGLPIFYVDISSDDCKFEVNSDLPVYFEWFDPLPPVDFDLIEEDGKQYLAVTRINRPLYDRYEIMTGRAYTDDVEGGFCRNFIIVCHSEYEDQQFAQKMQSRASDAPGGFRSVYSQYIGKSTRSYLLPGNEVKSVFMYERFFDENGNYSEKDLTISTTNPSSFMVEYEGSSLSQVTKSWGLNIGISHNFKIGKKKQKLNGSFNLGITDKKTETESKEYYMNVYGVKTAEVKLNMDKFEYEEGGLTPDKRVVAFINEDFAAAIFCQDSKSFNPNKFFDLWGTDVITQASFGGYYLYLYGRQQNAYEHSVAVDAMASIKLNRNGEVKDWVDIWKAKNSNIGAYDLGFNYNTSEYHQSSQALALEIGKGGSISYRNPEAWANGFNDDANWALTGFRLDSDEMSEEDITLLYPIEQLAENLVYTYYFMFKDKLTDSDLLVFQNAKNNVDKLINAKAAYLESKVIKEPEPKRLVVADIYMKKFNGIKQSGNALPFTQKDPTEKFADKYLTYYPMMANVQAPTDHEYPFSAGRNDYATAWHYDDMIFYYALAPEDQCQGIVDVVFEEKISECPDGSYVKRGDDARIGRGMNNKKNCVYVKYYDSEDAGYSEKDKITAFALVLKEGDKSRSSKHIYASSGGSERKPAFTNTQLNNWKKFWDEDEETGKAMHWNKCVWFEGAGLIKYHDLWPAYSTKDLPIKQLNEKSVVHPKKY